MKRKNPKIFICIITVAVLCSSLTAAVFAQKNEINYDTKEDIAKLADEIINWKANTYEVDSATVLVEKKLSPNAGDSLYDWYALGMARLPNHLNFPVYKESLISKILQIYSSSNIENIPVTDFHRMSLTVLALGGDPTKINQNEINLVADHTYNRKKISPLDKQGITGWLWALITLDSMQYDIPQGNYYSREEIIKEILSYQNSGGAFSLTGKNSDPDITAMAVQGLSPYYNGDKTYTYTRISDNSKVQSTVKQSIDKALMKLSALQQDTGDFSSWGNKNVQTGTQVILALCCLGIDPQRDNRFIKDGKTLVDGLKLYQCEDKGFSNTYPAKKANSKATEQVLYTLAALQRHMSGMRRLYDMRTEQTAKLKGQISSLVLDISNINKKTSKKVLESLDERFKTIPENERMYVYNYNLLQDALKNFVEPQESKIQSSQNSSSKSSKEDSSINQIISQDEYSKVLSEANVPSKTSNIHSLHTESISEDSQPEDSGSILLIIFIISAIILILGVTIFIYFKRKGGQRI